MVKSTLVPVCVAATMAIGLVTSLSADHSWGPPYHWARTSNPFTLQVGDNLSSTWKPYLTTAISDWDASSVLNLTKVAGKSNRNCRPTSGRIEVCNASYGNNGWLGIAQIWITGGEHITQAVMKMNDYYYNSPTYNTFAWRQMVMCQEIGHDFGLDHQDENFNNGNLGTCMDYTSNPSANPDNLNPDAHDYQQLEIIYNHLDSTTTIGSALPSAAPAAMGLLEFDTPAQWGKSVHRSANGRQEMFEFDFGRGNKVVTHVFWADPENDAH